MKTSMSPNKFQLTFSSSVDSPFAYCADSLINVAQFKNDVLTTVEQISQSEVGEILITTQGRYAFSVGLLASWLAGRTVLLPPDQHEYSVRTIRKKHVVGFECDHCWGETLARTNNSNLKAKEDCWVVELQGDFKAVVLYTSGSTGAPRAVEKSISNLFHEVDCLSSTFTWSNAAILGTVPVNHSYGLTFTILLPWKIGAPIVDDVPMFVQDITRVISQTNAQTLISVPVHYNALLQADFKADGLFCLSATALLQKQTATNWFEKNKTQLLEIYGSTETGVIGFRRQLDDPQWCSFESVELSVNVESLTVKSPFISKRWSDGFATADQVILSGEDKFYLLGRSDSIVKIGGKRTSLIEIEHCLLNCPGIVDAAAIAVPVDGVVRDNAIWAAVVLQGSIVSTTDLRTQLRKKLDSISIPRRFIFVDRLPRNSNGKIPRQALENLFKSNDITNV